MDKRKGWIDDEQGEWERRKNEEEEKGGPYDEPSWLAASP